MSKNVCVISLKDYRQRKGEPGCHCTHVEGDEDTEILECKACGRGWTAFNWILWQTRTGRWLKHEEKELRGKREALQEEVEKLRSQRNYLKRALK